MKLVHGHTRVGREGDVKAAARNRQSRSYEFDGELVAIAFASVTNSGFISPYAHEAQRSQYRIVKRSGSPEVGNAEGKVMEHVVRQATSPIRYRPGEFGSEE